MSGKQVIEVLGLKTIESYSQAVRATGLVCVSGQPAS
jgi:enamine deaminase RidA (YjgF/YER057c/UK114 family)